MFNLKSFFGDANNRINNYQKSPPKHVADKLSTLNITGSLSLAAIEKMREKREEAEEIAGKIQKSIKEKASQPTQEKDLTQLSTINELTAHLSEANLTIAAQAIDALNGKEIDLGSIQLYRPKNGESELARRTTPVYKKVPLKFKVRIAN
jgi:ArsR family metal-binding transcriptional regulator